MREEFIFSGTAPADSPAAVLLAGSSWCDGSYAIERSGADLWVAEFIESGTGTLTVNRVSCRPSAGDLYLVPPMSRHRYSSSAESPWVKHWINFSGPLMPELMRLYRLEGVFYVPKFSRPELFKNAHHQLRLHPQEAHTRIGPEFLMGLVVTMAADRNAATHRHQPSPEAAALREWLDTLVFAPAPSLLEMAAKISRSRGQTIRIFKNEYGETPIQYLIERKLEAARMLLRGSPMAIKKIAEQLCFSDEYYFAAMFKRKTGIAPGRYRAAREK